MERGDTQEDATSPPGISMSRFWEVVLGNDYRGIERVIKQQKVSDAELGAGLFHACRSGLLDTALAILEAGLSPNTEDPDNRSPLMVAARHGHHSIVQLLITWECNVHFHGGPFENTALHEAASQGYLECCRILVDSGVDVNVRNSQDDTSLILAAHGGNAQVIRYLLSRGASVRYRGHHDRTALHVGAENGHVNCCKLFIMAEADIEADDAFGHTPLISAAEKGFIEPTRVLLTQGADVNNVCHSAATALHFAAQHGNTECCKLLLNSGAEIDAQDIRRYTPLMMASMNGHSDTVSLLVEWKSNVNMAAYNRRTALHLAAERGKLTCSSLLLEADSQIDAQDSNLCTPVHLAASRGHTDVLQFLIESGSDLDKRTTNGNSLLHKAAAGGDVNCCKLVMSKGFGLDLQNNDGDTPLIVAVSSKQIQTVKFLLESGCNVNVRGQHGMTALNKAVFHNYGSCQIVKTLLDNGADPDIPDDVNTSPLWFAVDSGNSKVIKLLAQANAVLGQPSSLSSTCGPCNPLEHSVHKQDHVAVEALARIYNQIAVNTMKNLLSSQPLLFYPVNSSSTQFSQSTRELVHSIASSTSLLTNLSRRSIRGCLGKGGQVKDKIQELTLPKSLVKFLLLEDLDME